MVKAVGTDLPGQQPPGFLCSGPGPGLALQFPEGPPSVLVWLGALLGTCLAAGPEVLGCRPRWFCSHSPGSWELAGPLFPFFPVDRSPKVP